MRPVAGWFDLIKMDIRKRNVSVIVINESIHPKIVIIITVILVIYNIPTQIIIGRTDRMDRY